MLIRPQTLSLITTHQCTAACDNCCFACSPKITKAIPVERLATLIDEAAAIASIKVVVFTGGECFLLGSKLDELITRAAGYGLVTRCVTNGYWAASQKAADTRVTRLVDAGLIEINFSTGPMHAEYVPVERVIHGARASLEAGLTTIINVETFEGCDFDVAGFTNHPDLRPHRSGGRLKVQRNVWIDNAEGKGSVKMRHKSEHSRFNPERKTPCKTIMNVVAVTPDQELIACCGLNMESIPELHLGSISDRTLQSVLDAAPDDLLKIWMHLDGPEAILEFVKKHDPRYELPLEVVHPCETCHRIYADPAVRQTLREHYREVEDDIIARYMTTLAIHELTTETWHIRIEDAARLALELRSAPS